MQGFDHQRSSANQNEPKPILHLPPSPNELTDPARQAKELRTVNHIGKLLLSTLDDRRLLQQMMEQLIELFAVERASFWRVDALQRRVIFQFSLNHHGLEDELPHTMQEVPSLPLGEGIVGWVAKTGRSLIENDVQNSALFHRELDELSGLPLSRNTLSVPLKQDGSTVGVVQLFNRLWNGRFEQDDKVLMDSIAPWLSLALRNAERFGQLEAVNQIGQRLLSTLNGRDILRHLMQELIGRFQVEKGSFWLVDHQARRVRFQFSLNHHGEEDEIGEAIRALPDEQFRFGYGFVGVVAQTGRPLFRNDVKSDPLHNGEIDARFEYRTRNILTVPLIRDSKSIGIIQILNRINDRPFTLDDQNLLMAISPWVAQALENAQLYEKTLSELEEAHAMQLHNELHNSAAEMTQGVVHNLKNYLGSARMQLKMALSNQRLSSRQQQQVTRVDDNIKRSMKIIQALLKPFSPTQPDIAHPKTMVDKAATLITVPEHITLALQVSERLPEMYAETEHVIDYFYELLTNAVEVVERSMRQGFVAHGRIEVHAEQTIDGYIEWFFSNNGSPILSTNWETIFQKFHTTSHRNQTQHFGLGLWGARTFFRRQGGDVRVIESDAQRTTFMVRLPVMMQGRIGHG